MAKYYVLREEVEAQVVNESYLGSLPRMGGNPQRVKDSAEIHGPRGEKSYAAMDDYVVKVGDMFLAVPKGIFLAMFVEVAELVPVESLPEKVELQFDLNDQQSDTSNESGEGLLTGGSLESSEENETVPFVEADFPFPEE